MNNKNIAKRGFTLIELAVVIVIVGLLIGAVLKGQELVQNARINAVISQVNGIESAFNSFREKYGALPGDFTQAQARLPGCNDAGTNCANGNGDGNITGTNGVQNATDTASAEGRMAFQHLAYAGMITGIVSGASAEENTYGQNFPAARTGGGYTIIYSSVGTPALTTHWLRLQTAAPNTALDFTTTGSGALSPSEAATIDRRMDDGNPLTGSVRAGGSSDNCTPSTGIYNERSSTRDCVLYFRMQ